MSQKKDPQKPIVESNAKSPLERLKGSVQHYDKPFEPMGVDNWEADLLEPNNTERSGEVPTHTAPTGTRYIRLREIPHSLQTSFERYLTDAGCPVFENEDGPLTYENDWIEWRQHRRPDRIAAHNSAEASAAVMRTFPSIAHEWELSDTDMAELLGLSSNVYRKWSAKPSHAHKMNHQAVAEFDLARKGATSLLSYTQQVACLSPLSDREPWTNFPTIFSMFLHYRYQGDWVLAKIHQYAPG